MAIIDLTQKDWKSWFKENWDIIGVYALPILGILLTWYAGSNCSGGLECLGIVVIALIGLGLGAIFAVITLIRTLVTKMKPTRLVWIVPLITFLLWCIISAT